MNSFALKGHILYSVSKTELAARENAYPVCENGVCRGICKKCVGGEKLF